MDLYTASALGLEGVVKCAITKNPSLALRPNRNEWTPLMYACMYCQENIVALLVNCVPSCVYSINAHSQTPLILATKSGNLNIVKMVAQPELLNCKDENGWTALFYAVYYEHVDVIYFLVKFGADINSRDYCSRTVLMTAVQNGSENVVALLLALGAKTELMTKDSGLRAIDLAHQLKILQLIILLSVSSVSNLKTLFCNLRLDDYQSVFKENDIDLDKFLKLEESDLKLLGVSKIGPRKVMALAIDKYNYLSNLRAQLKDSWPKETA